MSAKVIDFNAWRVRAGLVEFVTYAQVIRPARFKGETLELPDWYGGNVCPHCGRTYTHKGWLPRHVLSCQEKPKRETAQDLEERFG
jgi:hypothetical protein